MQWKRAAGKEANFISGVHICVPKSEIARKYFRAQFLLYVGICVLGGSDMACRICEILSRDSALFLGRNVGQIKIVSTHHGKGAEAVSIS